VSPARYYRRRLARRPSGAPGRRSAKPVSVEAAVARAALDGLDPACWPGSLAAQGLAPSPDAEPVSVEERAAA